MEALPNMPDIMGKMDIAFPHLGIYLHNIPKSFQIGNFTIALYGCIFALGILAGMLMAAHMGKVTGQDPDTYWDVAIWLVVFSIIGARTYYVIFFWDAYKDNLLQVFNLRGGGLAIYGGVIAGFITLVIYSRLKKKNFLQMLDTTVYGLILGQIIGRWANFTNREVFGRYTDSLFAMRIPVEMVRERDITPDISAHITGSINYIQVHPTFLYESLWNVGVLLVMLYFARRKRFNGAIALIYFGGYGLGRAWIEAIRTDQLYLIGTHIPVSEVLGILMFVLSVAAAILAQRQVKQGKRECIDYAAVKPFEKPAEETAAKTGPAEKPESRPAASEESAGTAKDDKPEKEAEEKTACGENSQIPAAEAEKTGASDELKDEAARAAAEFLQQSGDGSQKGSACGEDEKAGS